MSKVLFIFITSIAVTGLLYATSTIDPERSLSWSPSLGWVDWHPSTENGAVIGEFICSGFLWAPNTGWIHLGNSLPANRIHYANDSGEDYGVNHDGTGRLRGLAWSPNIGWIVFEEQGNPRIDLQTGELGGAVWMPNAGWLFLDAVSAEVLPARTAFIAPGKDSDNDGLADAWELSYAENLDSLLPEGDESGNGMSNREAYIAGLNPLDPKARFQIVEIQLEEAGSDGRYDVTWTSNSSRVYRLWFSKDLSSWEQIGPDIIIPEEGDLTHFSHSISNEMAPATGFFQVEVLHPLRRP